MGKEGEAGGGGGGVAGGGGGLPAISRSEWVVMRALWSGGPQTANEVASAVGPEQGWKPQTVQTLLRRLVQKGALSYEKRGREFVFRAEVSEADCEHELSRSFLQRFFDGELAPFLARMVEREKLGRKEIEELKRILDERGPE